jgi:hypothetical protein
MVTPSIAFEVHRRPM